MINMYYTILSSQQTKFTQITNDKMFVMFQITNSEKHNKLQKTSQYIFNIYTMYNKMRNTSITRAKNQSTYFLIDGTDFGK